MSDATKNTVWAIAAAFLLGIAQKVSGAADNDALVWTALFVAIRAHLDNVTGVTRP